MRVGLLVLISALLFAACATPTPTSSPTTTPTTTPDQYAIWLTYVNEVYRYQFQYPPEASVREANRNEFGIISGTPPDDDWRDSLYAYYTGQICVTITTDHGFIAIGAPPNEGQHVGQHALCGVTDIDAYEVVSHKETLTINEQTYTAEGYEFRGPGETLDQHYEFYKLTLANDTRITYGSQQDRNATYADYLADKEILRLIIQSIQPLEVTAVPTPDFSQAPPVNAPLLTGFDFALDNWSPDGAVLTFWEYTQVDYEAALWPPAGTYHFYSVRTSEHCAYPPENELGLNFNGAHMWLPDGRFLVFKDTGELVVFANPCRPDVITLADHFLEPIVGLKAASANGPLASSVDVPPVSTEQAVLLLRGQTTYWFYETHTEAEREAKGLAGLPLAGRLSPQKPVMWASPVKKVIPTS